MIIDSYIIREVLKPLVAILGILVLIFVGFSLARFLAYAVDGLLPLDVLSSFVLLKAAIALEILVPVALYLSVILVLGRMNSDGEITAIRASGIGFHRVLGVILTLSLALAAAVAGLSLYGRPLAYERSYWIKAQADAETDLDKLQSASFYDNEERERTIFVDHVDTRALQLHRVFIRGEKRGVLQIVSAREGEQRLDATGTRRRLILSDVRVYALSRDQRPDKGIGRFKQMTIDLHSAKPLLLGYKRKAAATGELAASDLPGDIAELQWRISTPVSTVLLALLAAYLSRMGGVRGRHAKVLAALVIYAIYYNLSAMARTWVESGIVGPFPGIWWVQVALALVVAGFALGPRRAFAARRAHGS